MKTLPLLTVGDFAGMFHADIISNIITEYSDEYKADGDSVDHSKEGVAKRLAQYDLCVVYEDNCGYEGNSLFILRNKFTGVFAVNTASHCSCYGFEGKFEPDEMPNEYFHTAKFYLDDDAEQKIKEWIEKYIPKKTIELQPIVSDKPVTKRLKRSTRA